LLLSKLEHDCGLRHSAHLSAGEKLMIFMYFLSGQSNRNISERFQHSGSVISRVIHEIKACLNSRPMDFLVSPTYSRDIPQIKGNPLRDPFL
jgi:hypothetical protein